MQIIFIKNKSIKKPYKNIKSFQNKLQMIYNYYQKFLDAI